MKIGRDLSGFTSLLESRPVTRPSASRPRETELEVGVHGIEARATVGSGGGPPAVCPSTRSLCPLPKVKPRPAPQSYARACTFQPSIGPKPGGPLNGSPLERARSRACSSRVRDSTNTQTMLQIAFLNRRQARIPRARNLEKQLFTEQTTSGNERE